MKIRILITFWLAALLAAPVVAQQAPAANDDQTPVATSSQTGSTASSSSSTNSPQSASSDQNMSALQPLQPDYREGFWGKLNPFARKKYVQRQLSPIRNRVNELDDLTAANSKEIKDVDARAQEGIRQASLKADEANQHAVNAGDQAQQASQTATQANHRLNTVEQVVGNIDQYQPATETEIRFRPGQTALSPKAQSALDDMATNLKDQKGYIVEVQGYSRTHGQAGIQTSQAMANSVVRYLVEKHDIPVYRIFVMGMGNAPTAGMQANDNESSSVTGTPAKPYVGNRVEVSLLKNNVDQLAMANQPGGRMNPNGATTTSSSNHPSQPLSSNSTNADSTGTSNPPQQ